ncbi:hypothetical protein CO666_03600 [Rhizobium chutanense]|uniref:Phage tail assembly protein n=1 Tax=Rhizobium chutanense TaxID=2035448 RepID=A0A2A6JHH7_9HYPH|nr:hypothetical protein [Rhizobium chutanense]PDT05700.1 hypothetical protein CO666_03600 [Rhizobium chutanense]
MSNALSKESTVVIDLDEERVEANSFVDEDRPLALDGKRDKDVVDEDVNPLDQLPEDVVRNTNGSVTLPLYVPVTLRIRKGGEIRERKFSELIFHRLNGADQRAISAASKEHEVAVTFARSTRLNQATMNGLYDQMDLSDISRAGRVINFFVSNGPKTGG